MNENLPPKAPAIKAWLTRAVALLTNKGIASARLDAEIILAHTLRKSRTFLHAHDDVVMTDHQTEVADARLDLRLDRTPIAYIIGHKEFYGRTFAVTPATLIPRPESETIIDILKEQAKAHPIHRIVDVGAGSGCLGITAKLELPKTSVELVDISHQTLKVAEANARFLGANVTFLQSSLLKAYPHRADCVIANLPYVDKKWERSPETNFEPALALFAEHSGLLLIEDLITQLPAHLALGGITLIEADPRQHSAIINFAKTHHLKHVESRGFIVHLKR
jgi:release factor glutamine methyltransferase